MKQVWNDPRIWEGFVTCVKMMMPQSISVLLQLPPQQLEQLLRKNADIRDKILQAQAKGVVMIPKTLQQILIAVTPVAPPQPDGDAPYDPEQDNPAVQPVTV